MVNMGRRPCLKLLKTSAPWQQVTRRAAKNWAMASKVLNSTALSRTSCERVGFCTCIHCPEHIKSIIGFKVVTSVSLMRAIAAWVVTNILIARGDGTGGKSIYGDKFADENLFVLNRSYAHFHQVFLL
jgi:hypothetical protein